MPARLSINIFSPLPPLSTAIASHTADFLPWLGQAADVTIWTRQEHWTALEAEGVRVRSYSPDTLPWDDLNRAAATFFNFGNHTGFHKDIFHVASVLPGVVVLHDTSLQHFFAGLAVNHGWQQEYLAAMGRHHGPEGARQAQAFLAGKVAIDDLSQHYPLSFAAAERALAMICHNSDDAKALQARTRLPVHHLDLSLNITGIREPSHRVLAPPYTIVVFGFLASNRRLPSLLRALAELPERDSFRLRIFGRIEDDEVLRHLVSSLGLERLVEIRGFVATAELDRALAAAHLAVNLRYPSMGEASVSQLRIWAHALPSIVTRTGWYATLPPDAVFFVDPNDEATGLKRHLAQFLVSPEVYAAAGHRGRGIVADRHAPRRYAHALWEIAHDAPAHRRRRTSLDLARSSGRALMAMTGLADVERAAPRVAKEIANLGSLR